MNGSTNVVGSPPPQGLYRRSNANNGDQTPPPSQHPPNRSTSNFSPSYSSSSPRGGYRVGLGLGGGITQANLVYLTLGALTIVSVFNTLYIISFSKQQQEAGSSSSSSFRGSFGTSGGESNDYSFSLAYQDSFGLLDDISNKSWNLMKLRVKNRINHKYPQNPTTGSHIAKNWYQENFEPDFSCPHEQRVGGMGDGGKWVCNPHRLAEIGTERKAYKGHGCLIYSIGSEGNFMFETGMAQLLGEIGRRNCEIHVFDPTTKYGTNVPKEYEHLIFFHGWGLKSSRTDEWSEPFWGALGTNTDGGRGNPLYYDLGDGSKGVGPLSFWQDGEDEEEDSDDDNNSNETDAEEGKDDDDNSNMIGGDNNTNHDETREQERRQRHRRRRLSVALEDVESKLKPRRSFESDGGAESIPTMGGLENAREQLKGIANDPFLAPPPSLEESLLAASSVTSLIQPPQSTQEFFTLQETIEKLGHTNRIIDVFKIDCESCEWTTYKDWLESPVDIRQILVEVHNAPYQAVDFFTDLQTAGYVTFHKEPNIQYSDGNCQEYCFLKLDTPFFS